MKSLIFAFFVFFSFSCHLNSLIIETENLDQISQEFQKLDSEALVVFDVDGTLIVPNDLILKPCGEKKLQAFMRTLRSEDPDKKKHLESIVLHQSQISLVNKKVVKLIHNLQSRKIRAVALTAMDTGQLGIIPSMEDWRFRQLANFNIRFDKAFTSVLDPIRFEEFYGKGTTPVFKKGILASSKYSKGEVLTAFLKQMNFKPSKIIFIDDRLHFITSVEEALEKMQIPHVSFFYKEVFNEPVVLDEQLADFQLQYLLDNEVWLTDDEAKKLILVEEKN